MQPLKTLQNSKYKFFKIIVACNFDKGKALIPPKIFGYQLSVHLMNREQATKDFRKDRYGLNRNHKRGGISILPPF